MSTPRKIAITLAAAGVSLLGPLAQAAPPFPAYRRRGRSGRHGTHE